jgi:hypothetical protein
MAAVTAATRRSEVYPRGRPRDAHRSHRLRMRSRSSRTQPARDIQRVPRCPSGFRLRRPQVLHVTDEEKFSTLTLDDLAHRFSIDPVSPRTGKIGLANIRILRLRAEFNRLSMATGLGEGSFRSVSIALRLGRARFQLSSFSTPRMVLSTVPTTSRAST